MWYDALSPKTMKSDPCAKMGPVIEQNLLEFISVEDFKGLNTILVRYSSD